MPEEGLVRVLGVVLLDQGALQLTHLKGDDPQPLALDTADDLADETAADTVRLDQHERALGHGFDSSVWWETCGGERTAT